MRTSKWFALTLAAAVAAGGLFTLHARAAERAKPRGAAAGKLRERVKEKLELTDEQITQIKAQLKGEKDTIKALLTRMHDTRVGLRTAIQKPDATEGSVRDAAAKVAAVESDLAVERLKLHGKISPILTAEQREKLSEFRAGVDQFVDRLIDRAHKRLGE